MGDMSEKARNSKCIPLICHLEEIQEESTMAIECPVDNDVNHLYETEFDTLGFSFGGRAAGRCAVTSPRVAHPSGPAERTPLKTKSHDRNWSRFIRLDGAVRAWHEVHSSHFLAGGVAGASGRWRA
jgi:hypothetical protein